MNVNVGTSKPARMSDPVRLLWTWPQAATLAVFLATAGVHPADAPETNSPPRLDLTSFRIISDRNIFNANRSRGSGRDGQEARKSVRVDTFALVGLMDYDKGRHAFFDGSSSDYRKVLKTNGTIGGFTIKDITLKGVKLEATNQTVELRMGMQMRREEEGEWKPLAQGESQSTSSGSGADSSSSSHTADGGDVSDIVKRMMQQREQETK
jgi:hypothetical protein